MSDDIRNCSDYC